MIRLSWIILSASLLFLSACVPSKGSSSLTAFNIISDDIELMAGDEWWYVSRSWSPETFSVKLADPPNILDAFEGLTIRKNLSGFTAIQKGLPENWNFELYEVTGIQKITSVYEIGNELNVAWEESIVTIFTLEIPEGTHLGTYSGLVAVEKEGDLQIIPVNIEISDNLKTIKKEGI
jgi:hypothetical protein